MVRALGPDHPFTEVGRYTLANAFQSLGRYQQAADLHRDVLATRERVLGPDHPDTLDSRNNLTASLTASTGGKRLWGRRRR
jgi:hypothetical protein